MKPSFCVKVLITIFFAGSILLQGCAGAPDEETASTIYSKAKELYGQKKTLEALREIDKLADFKDTQVFKKAKAALLREGITIGSGLESWSVKKMVDIQNYLIDSGREKHPYGRTLIKVAQKDGWGNNFQVEYTDGTSKDKILFFVRSAGPDGSLKTSDDLLVYHRNSGNRKANSPRPRSNKKESRTVGQERQPASSGDSSVDLKDILSSK